MIRLCILILCVGLLGVAHADPADEPQPGSDLAEPTATFEAEVADLPFEVADLPAEVADLPAEVADLPAEPEPVGAQPVFQSRLWGLYGEGWYGGAEATILAPLMSGAQPAFQNDLESGSLIDQQFRAGVRYQIGWVNEAGLGVRGRYWSYDQFFKYVPPGGNNTNTGEPEPNAGLGIDLQAADLEATISQRVWNWDTLLSGGARYGKLSYVNPVATFLNEGAATFEGVGPTVAVEGRRRLGGSGFSLYGNIRGSFLLGSVANEALFLSMPQTKIYGEVMGVAENQLGITWDWEASNGFIIEARAVWETQYWMNNVFEDDVYGIGTNLGLTGPTLGLVIRF